MQAVDRSWLVVRGSRLVAGGGQLPHWHGGHQLTSPEAGTHALSEASASGSGPEPGVLRRAPSFPFPVGQFLNTIAPHIDFAQAYPPANSILWGSNFADPVRTTDTTKKGPGPGSRSSVRLRARGGGGEADCGTGREEGSELS